jgi:tRNA(His) guanylyltransferase
MDSDEFESRMRGLEYFHSLRILPGTWPVIRVDGKGFSKFTEARFDKPFEERFSRFMAQTAEALLVAIGGVYAYTESDEISVLLPRDWDLYDREVEKAVSISAGIASSTFTLACGEPAVFDSRVWIGPSEDLVVDYFRWRQADAGRCALNGWAYWTLRQAGESVDAATRALHDKSVAEKNELLFQHGINFNDVPLWQRRGVGLYWEAYEKVGFNPVTKQEARTSRRRVKVDRELPMKDEYGAFVRGLLAPERPVRGGL